MWQLGLAALMLSTVLVSGCALLNEAPVIISLEVEKDSLCANENCEIRVVAYDPDKDELGYQWQASGGDISGQGATAIWTTPDSSGTYVITVEVTDGRGGRSEMQLSLEVIPNTPPTVESLTTKRARVNRAEFIVVECVASDADGDRLNYNWTATGGTFYGSGPVIAWEAPLVLGSYTITVAIDDGRGGEALAQLTLSVTVNHSPVIESLTADQTLVLFGKSTTITCVASDPDGDRITYLWTAADGEISGEGSEVVWTAPDECGDYVAITVSVIDDRGGEVSREIQIWVRKPG